MKLFWRTCSWLGILLISACGFVGLHWLQSPEKLARLGLSGLVTIGLIGTWRWSWWGVQILRSRWFLHVVFPRWRKRANAIPTADLPPICILVPTYHEQEWISERVFRAIALEAQTLPQPLTLLVTSSGDEENALIRAILTSVDPELKHIHLIQMVQNGQGKRKAMADGLRALAELNLPQDTVVALMDGDSEITPGTLLKCVPFFRLFPKMGALTTDELPIVKGSYLFAEWFELRMSQRHYQMSSVSLSRKVMCLTGRFSLFRGEAALDPTFADQLEVDTLNDWLWGKFKFLSGDDKSTWFWLLKHGYDMIYVPDAIVYSIETISGSLLKRGYQNMRRWYGNMLRNSERAIALGPVKNGWFMWWCLIDQRISCWTSLISPTLLILYFCQGHWLAAGIITCWILLTRPLMLILIFCGRNSTLKPIHFPILLMAQWSSSIIKIWTQMNLAQQKWSNRGNQSISAAGSGWVKVARLSTSRFLFATQVFSFLIFVLWLTHIVNPIQDINGMLWNNQVQAAAPTQIIDAIDHGVFPSDGKDDSAAIMQIINQHPAQTTIQINLPLGEIDLNQPIKIHRSQTIIHGEGIGRTILQPRFKSSPSAAVISIHPSHTSKQPVREIQLDGFTVPSTQNDAIVLEQVTQAKIANLDLENSRGYSLVLRETKDIKIEYVALDESQPQSKIMMTKAINTQIDGLEFSQFSS